MRENALREYLKTCEKDALIELYLQIRFERDLMTELYEEQKKFIDKNKNVIRYCGTCSHQNNCIKSDL